MTRRRKLGDDERKLWADVVRSVRPISEGAFSGMVATVAPPPAVAPPIPEPTQPGVSLVSGKLSRRQHPSETPASGLDIAPHLSEALAGGPLRMDRKAFDALRRGKLSPEARVDLHGLTLAQAQVVLQRFIIGAQTRGLRLVLVITGKGRARADLGPIPTPVGILRHQAPQWLSAPPLAPLVQQVSQAHQRHGGEGAFYVYLRRPAGSRRS